MTLDELLSKITSDNPDTRADAWQEAGEVGVAAIEPLAKVAAEGELEVARAATHAMWKIVRTVGAPEVAGRNRQAVGRELAGLIGDDRPVAIRRDALWMISELCAGKGSVPEKIAGLLHDKQVREDARCCLERIPGDKTLGLLKAALETVPDDFKINVAQSLRARGVEVSEAKYPCRKLAPTKQTNVEPFSKE